MSIRARVGGTPGAVPSGAGGPGFRCPPEYRVLQQRARPVQRGEAQQVDGLAQPHGVELSGLDLQTAGVVLDEQHAVGLQLAHGRTQMDTMSGDLVRREPFEARDPPRGSGERVGGREAFDHDIFESGDEDLDADHPAARAEPRPRHAAKSHPRVHDYGAVELGTIGDDMRGEGHAVGGDQDRGRGRPLGADDARDLDPLEGGPARRQLAGRHPYRFRDPARAMELEGGRFDDVVGTLPPHAPFDGDFISEPNAGVRFGRLDEEARLRVVHEQGPRVGIVVEHDTPHPYRVATLGAVG